LDFLYLVNTAATNTSSIIRIAAASFAVAGLLVDAGVEAGTSGVAPMTDDRSLLDGGKVVGFNFNVATGGVPPNSNTMILEIQTNATAYTSGTMTISQGSSDTKPAFAPLSVPEPTSLTLLGSGLMGLGLLVHRRMTMTGLNN